MRSGPEHAPAAAQLDQVAEPRGMVVVAVAQHHRVDALDVDAQAMRIAPRMRALSAVEEDALAAALDQHRQAVLVDQSLVFRRKIVHQRGDFHAPRVLSVSFVLFISRCFKLYTLFSEF